MSLIEFAPTLDELLKSINLFVKSECEKGDGHLIHKNCGGAIRVGFLNLFYINDNGTLDPGYDGFGIGPKQVPYCEDCFPPNGFNFAYPVRFPILRERCSDQDYQFTWGNREHMKQRLLLP